MDEPRAYTPQHLADKILRSRSALVGERKQVTVMFVDVANSLRLAASVDPEEWHRILDRLFALLAGAIHRFEGTVNQYTGDGVMALFGAPLAHEDHAQRACHAALALCGDVRRFAHELRRTHGLKLALRVGLNSGEVVVGAIGDDLRMDYTAQGQTVGLAARMQQSARPDRVYLTEQTAALVGDYFALEPVEPMRVKGVRGRVRAFALADAARARSRLDAARARGFTRFVARGPEVAALERALERARGGDGQVVRVVGPAGVGKSRLCHEALERARAAGIAVAAAQCASHGRNLPDAALAALLAGLCGIDPGERAAQRRTKLRAELRRLRSAGPEDQVLLLELLGLPAPRGATSRLDAATRRERVGALVCALVQARSARLPFLLLLDDAHWIDPESEAFLARLVDAVAFTRALLVVAARPGAAPAWADARHASALELAPLAPAESEHLLQTLLGVAPELAKLRATVAERAQGNPLFAEELVRGLIAQGVLASAPGAGARLVQPLEPLRLPASLQALLAARIDALPAAAKAVLQVAAVIGARFEEPVLAGACVAEDAAPDFGTALAALHAADLVRTSTESRELAFEPALLHEVAYAAQLEPTRQARHAAVAQALQSVHAERLGEHAALLAHHFDAAGRRHEARRWRNLAALRVTHIQLRRPASSG